MFNTVVDEEGTGADLCCNVEELGESTEAEVFVAEQLAIRSISFGGIFIPGNFCPFRQFVDHEKDKHNDDDSSYTDINHLYVVHVLRNICAAGDGQEEHAPDDRP